MFCISHQCSRKACRKAERPSITRRTVTVRTAKAAKISTNTTEPIPEENLSPTWRTIRQSTSDSSVDERETLYVLLYVLEMNDWSYSLQNRPAWARLRAQSRRYEAVLEMQPRQNSIVWMAWYTKMSLMLACKWRWNQMILMSKEERATIQDVLVWCEGLEMLTVSSLWCCEKEERVSAPCWSFREFPNTCRKTRLRHKDVQINIQTIKKYAN